MIFHTKECGKHVWPPHKPLKWNGVSPAVNRSCRNSSTVPTEQLTVSSWWSLHHEVKTLHFKAYSFLVEEALEWRMVSTTSVEKPESVSWAPSEAKPTVSTVLVGGEISSPPLGTEGPSWRGAPEGYYIWEPYSAGPPRGNGISRTRSRWTLSRTPGSRAIEGNAYRRSLGHICTKRSWMREGEPEWTVRRLSRRKQIHLCLAKLPPYQLHHLGVEPQFPGPQPLSRQDVCSYIVDPRDVSCSQRQQLPLGSQEDLARQFASGRDVGDHRCVVWAHGGPWDLLGNS